VRQQIASFLYRNPIERLTLFRISDLPISFFSHLPHLRELSASIVSVHPKPAQPKAAGISKIRTLRVQPYALMFVKHIVAAEDAPVDLAGVTTLWLELGAQRDIDDNGFREHADAVLRGPTHLEDLTVMIDEDYDPHVAYSTGDILLKLAPTSRRTLRRLRIEVSANERGTLAPFAGLVGELAQLAGPHNALEELHFSTSATIHADLDLDPAQWRALDTVLAQGFPRLRRVHISATDWVQVYWHSGEETERAVREKRAQIEKLFAEQFDWLHANVEFTTDVDV